ncbi:ribosomal protein L4 [Suhomyces tanzawaensis NRRL Y-17324]|uniref:Large ribosomal subunit protein uL4m n=1 Tax=Suhomyces tanzawaensis NRRL Y-17324 TaxID=984487 RepID=A0A1E4SRI8_9ASCO|nr:ribosomal protein L4 [Suhomyces tanzawaensis NRRL Y-17324]ODV82115.1 ribosomal protein L4 [Suhomyces tanzawaensis NRRL Y-17324]
MLRQSIRTLATEASAGAFKIAQPPKYTLASLRTFPSLEPQSFVPLPATFLDAPLRRDFLWSAVVYEADKARVGSGNVPTKGDKPFSNRKLHPQKGTGRARVGDANSPIRDNGIKAHGIKAGHDWSTELPSKIYSRGFQTALSEQYRNGKLFIIGGDKVPEYDQSILDFKYSNGETTRQFVDAHDLDRLSLLFITDAQRDNLLESTEVIGKKADVLVKEAVEVRDILKANRVYIELPALQWLISKYSV